MEVRTCRLHAQNDLRIDTVEASPLQPGEVLVAVGAGGICGSDLHYWQDGGFGPIRVREPIILGHEAAGTVVALGAGVEHLEEGDRVALNPSHPCGSCRYCAEGNPNHCIGMRFKGSAMRFPHEQGLFRDRIAMAATQCLKVEPGIPMAEAALAEPLAVCLRAFGRAASIAGGLAGKRVMVTGAGPIGALCTALAAHFGAAEVIVTDIQDATLAVAAQVGATRTVNVVTDCPALEPLQEDKGQIDVVFECSAAPAAMRTAMACIRPQGTIVEVGITGDSQVPLNLLVGKEINLIGTHRFHHEFAESVKLINARALPLRPIVTHSFPLDRALEAFATAADRAKAVKVQLTFA